MERTKKVQDHEEGAVRWRKVGGGSFRMRNGKIIKPNQVFWATPEEVPMGFRDTIIPLSELPEEKPTEIIYPTYQIQVRTPGWFDIVDQAGKVINEQALREDKAKEMLERLTQ